MANPTPLEPGKYYHIYNRGNNRENIFNEERNYAYFLKRYAYHIGPIADTYAYCLLRNHFHLFARIKDLTGVPTSGEAPAEKRLAMADEHLSGRDARTQDLTGVPTSGEAPAEKRLAMAGEHLSGLPNPSQAFSNFFNAYARAFNSLYHRTGALFQRPFGRIEVTTEVYLYRLVVYIHQNPQRHGFVTDFRDWPYSSYHALSGHKATHLQRADVLAWFGGRSTLLAVHEQPFPEGLVTALAPDDFD